MNTSQLVNKYENSITAWAWRQNSDHSTLLWPIRIGEPGAVFYTVSASVRPIPPGLVLFCIETDDYSILNIDEIYDPFNQRTNTTSVCITLLTWLQTVPYTTPLYVNRLDNGRICIDFNPNLPGKPLFISPLHVLIWPQGQIVPRFARLTPEVPIFKFSGYQGRCLPDPDGIDIYDCMMLYTKDILDVYPDNDKTTLREYLQARYQKKDSQNVWNWLTKNHPILTTVISALMILSLIIFIQITKKN
jgi:hypothetical protein